ncbi:MAG TPA: hypothetical protein VGM54_19050 [Chthoniobacter sp.]|jgi:hypothetical protein
MFQFSSGNITLLGSHDALPAIYAGYRTHAKLVEEFNLASSEGQVSFLAVGCSGEWPFLVIAQRYSPSAGQGFYPGALHIPDTGMLFVGAGERLLCYDLNEVHRIWEDKADTGFWSWSHHENVVLMSAELELAAWDTHGHKLWTTFVEPPWSFKVVDGRVQLKVMDVVSSFDLCSGPTTAAPSDFG